ncbi:MAG: ParB/RepB/Spo0J family partition protein [Rhodobacteraceae bacterium]|nr:ParB/RepB/Spo0J family partition protein [Paracoccaceae bacterium]
MADPKPKPRGLGRGLSALMADVAPVAPRSDDDTAPRRDTTVPIEKLFANPNQPRRRFGQDDLNDLAASIAAKGVIQPLIVRPREGGTYEIVAGERRWRAAQQAQLHELPVLIRDFTDTEVLEVAIIENIQRADLNPVEEAAGYRQLMDKFGHTQEKMAEALGKSRSHIANLLRLLNLPGDVQEHLREGRLSAGHARALVVVENPSTLAAEVIKGGLSVRATEQLAKRQGTQKTSRRKSGAGKPAKDADTQALEADLSAALGLPVEILHTPDQEAGELRIKYATLEDLDTLCRLLSGS